MERNSVYPVLMTENVEILSRFYAEELGFETTFESDWYISLAAAGAEGNFELAVLDCNHETIPEGYRTPSRGIIINIEVPNADTYYEKLISRGEHPVKLELRDEPWGQRHFITADPDGNLIDIIQEIEPSAEYLEQFSGE